MSLSFVHRSSRLLFRNNVISYHTIALGAGRSSLLRKSYNVAASKQSVGKSLCCISKAHSNSSTTTNTADTTTSRAFASLTPVEVSSDQDTIFALSSGAGVTAGVAIIRVSGPGASSCLSCLLQGPGRLQSTPKLPHPRYASVRKLYDPTSRELLDEAMVIFFPGPKSFTGEDVVEFHVHGSRAVINGVVEALGKLQHLASPTSVVRPAERGEFTRRAFENGRMDLTGVEGLADLIAAETSMQRKQALRQLGGEVRDTLESWREEIKSCLAHAEAVIDFGDDVDDDAFEAIVPRIQHLCGEMRRNLNDDHRGEIVRGGAKVVIVGEPNAGKSTLLNALARRPAAIVSPHAGTTRDIVEVQMDLDGLAVTVSDTAGLRDNSDDPIELEGMQRARDASREADITILVHDVSKGTIDDAMSQVFSRLHTHDTEGHGTGGKFICVANKTDLVSGITLPSESRDVKVLKTCLTNDEGVQELTKYVGHMLRKRIEGDGTGKQHSPNSMPIITRARHRHHMSLAVSALDSFLDGRTGSEATLYLPMDIAAEELRIAAKEVGAITGIIHVEEVLDVIFSDFCIGK